MSLIGTADGKAFRTGNREMDGDREKAERYRVRAEEVRAIAETMTDPATKKILTGVADDYVSMAESLDRIVERDKLLKSP